MKRVVTTIIIATLTLLGFAAGAQARLARVLVTTTARTTRLAGEGPNLSLESVTVDGSDLTNGAGDGTDSATMYGNGIVARFTQRGRSYYVTTVGVVGRSRLTIAYSLS
jgi:hypothetical protein